LNIADIWASSDYLPEEIIPSKEPFCEKAARLKERTASKTLFSDGETTSYQQ